MDSCVLESPVEAPEYLDSIFERALIEHATDIYIECVGDHFLVKIRSLDKVFEIDSLEFDFAQSLLNVIRSRAGLAAEHSWKAQDLRIEFPFNGANVVLRTNLYTSAQGPCVAIRVLDPKRRCIGIQNLGIDLQLLEKVKEDLTARAGLFLVSGPMGSGKTTTLHSLLETLDLEALKVITVEDPVEYAHEGMTQIALDEQVGLNYEVIIRSILRHDPDVIMIGEIRDSACAKIALQAALTGHLVVGTIHATEGYGAITRLKGLGVQGQSLASTLIGVLSQKQAPAGTLSLKKENASDRLFEYLSCTKGLRDLILKK